MKGRNEACGLCQERGVRAVENLLAPPLVVKWMTHFVLVFRLERRKPSERERRYGTRTTSNDMRFVHYRRTLLYLALCTLRL